MERVSANGILIPLDGNPVTEAYNGHFLQVSYTQLISTHPVFSKDRIDVEPDGKFRFFIPKKSLLATDLVTIEVYAPDGEMLGQRGYTHGALNTDEIPLGMEDESQGFDIQ